MVVKELEYEVKGNVIVKPNIREQEEAQRRYRELEEQKKKQRQQKKRILQEKARRRALLNKVVAAIFILGLSVIGLQVYVYGIQGNITDMKSEIKTINEDSQSMKMGIIQNSSLHNIKTRAESDYNMVIASKSDTVNIDLSQNYFSALDEADQLEKENMSKDESFIDKLMDVLR